MRAETAATFSVLLVLCTPWSFVLKALRVLRLPIVLVVILGHDVSLYFSVFAKRARHVHVPKEPDGRPSRRRGAATGGHGRRGRADVQKPFS
jgi:hypothetical protein